MKKSNLKKGNNRCYDLLNGVQVVAGSNPATPIFKANPCQNG